MSTGARKKHPEGSLSNITHKKSYKCEACNVTPVNKKDSLCPECTTTRANYGPYWYLRPTDEQKAVYNYYQQLQIVKDQIENRRDYDKNLFDVVEFLFNTILEIKSSLKKKKKLSNK